MRRWSALRCYVGRLDAVNSYGRRLHTSRALQARWTIARLLRLQTDVEDVEVNGWIRSVRKQKKVAFAALGDGSSLDPLQAVLLPEQVIGLSNGSAVRFKGSWQASKGSEQSHELHVSSVRILGENDAEGNPLQPKHQTPEYLRTIPHLRPRIPANTLLLRLRSQVIASLTRFFNDQGFIQTHTPIITSSDCEGAGEVFTLSANELANVLPKGDSKNQAHAEHFFRTPKYLTVSAQLHLEALAQAVDKVWTLSPTFRAEKSDTARHLSEFYMLEAEMCFTQDLSDIIDLVENMLRATAIDLRDSKLGQEMLQAKGSLSNVDGCEADKLITPDLLQQRWNGMAAERWPRVTYAEAMETLQRAVAEDKAKFVFDSFLKDGLQAEHERYLATVIGQGKPVFVTDYPRDQKPFYMSPSAATLNSGRSRDTAACFDLLVPDLCELAGGSMRESRLGELMQTMRAKGVAGSNLEWYQDLRKYGSVPHGGFGLGFDRLLCYLGGVSNVKEVVAFPRWYGRCDC